MPNRTNPNDKWWWTSTPWSFVAAGITGLFVWGLASEWGFPRGWLIVSIVLSLVAGRVAEYLTWKHQQSHRVVRLRPLTDDEFETLKSWIERPNDGA